MYLHFGIPADFYSFDTRARDAGSWINRESFILSTLPFGYKLLRSSIMRFIEFRRDGFGVISVVHFFWSGRSEVIMGISPDYPSFQLSKRQLAPPSLRKHLISGGELNQLTQPE